MALQILDKINQDSQINIRSINMKAAEGVYEGQIMLYINNTAHLKELIDRIKTVKGVQSVKRIDHR